jgi:gas vesicle protein
MKFFVGLFLGLGLGVGIGLLIAPQPGKVTRNQLTEQGVMVRATEFNDQVRARANEALAQGRELYSRTKVELTDRYNRTLSGNL